jgi:enamine deaminase RidA (YjgF/YER057c/UK114 family)/NAD(P)-dependent dehydrogenase (short-subunit alcohol dehydrogenase family)
LAIMSRIAVLGVGRMGAPIARRLLAAGHHVTVWNRTPARAAPLAEAGAVLASTPAEAADGADLVVVMLTDAAAVESALFGASPAGQFGAAGGLRAGSCLVQMSTISPDETRSLAARLPEGVSYLDAPVGGSVRAVEAGTLKIFAGGDPTALALAEPALRALGNVRHFGPVGAGAALKLVANTALVTTIAALHDTPPRPASTGPPRSTCSPPAHSVARSPAPPRPARPSPSRWPPRTPTWPSAPSPTPRCSSPRHGCCTRCRISKPTSAQSSPPPHRLGSHRHSSRPRRCHRQVHDRQGVLMKLTLDNPATVSAPFGDRFAHVARVDTGSGALLILAGQVGVDDVGNVVAPGDVVAQSDRIFEIIGGLLAAHGASFADVAHVRTFMTDLDDLPGYGAVRDRVFPSNPPASTTVEVSRLFLPGAVLEVEVTAVVRQR